MGLGWRWIWFASWLGGLGACTEAAPPPPRPDVLTLEIGGAPRRLPEVLATVAPKPTSEPASVAEIARLTLPPRPRFAELREGETLSELSARALGTARRWREIAELNAIPDPTRVAPGTRLKLPPE